MRIISFALTLDAFAKGTKTVTRRNWKHEPKVGDKLQAWDRSPRNGGKRIGTILITGVKREPIHDMLQYGRDELEKEGGLWKSPGEFITMLMRANPDMLATDKVWRIEFEKIDD